jgi:acetate kinase
MATKIILAVNAGSSSVKVSVFAGERDQSPRQLAEAQVSGLTAPPAKLDYTRGQVVVAKGRQVQGGAELRSQDDAFALVLQTLVEDDGLPEIRSRDAIAIVCHRIVHGGDYAEAQIISDETYHHLEALSDLAPLHNASSLAIVRSCMRKLPSATNVAYFDSQFHASLPEHIRTYPIDQTIARKNGLRKYGFHGISYAFITRSVAEYLGKPRAELNLIALHLGSGASACAIKAGQSWDTSMGLTPLAGLPGATRSGSVDPRYALPP